MASRTVTLFLDGTPTLADYASAVEGFNELLSAIARQVGRKADILWEVEDLAASTALLTVRGEAEDISLVEQSTDEVLHVGRQLARRPFVPGYEKSTKKLRRVLNGRVPLLRFETADDDVTIAATPSEAEPIQAAVDYGAVEGRIQTLSNRGGLRFTLYDLLYDKAVSCYLAEGSEHLMRDAWGRVALVEGLVKRDSASGRPLAVRQVSIVTPLEEGSPSGWRAAVGVLRGLTDGEPAEETIRRLRNAE